MAREIKNFGFNYQEKKYNLDVEEYKNIFSQSRGLMFRRKSRPLLFVFKKPVLIPIHSFFCKPFIIIWFNKNEVIDVKKVNSWKFSIKPEKKFDKFLEIPSSNTDFLDFTDG